MSEKMLHVTLSDLAKIRVKCQGTLATVGGTKPCRMSYEVDLADLATGTVFPDGKCLRCNQPFNYSQSDGPNSFSGHPDQLRVLSKAIEILKTMGKQLQVEFDVPAVD